MVNTILAAILGLQMSTPLISAALIPIPKEVPVLRNRVPHELGSRSSQLRRQGADYLHGYDGTQNSSVVIYPMSTDDEFSFILSEVLSMSNGGGAATSEVLRAASQIIPGDFDSWFNEFYWLGEQIHAQALVAKTVVSAREAYFRASTYYRISSFFLTGNASDPRLYRPWQQALEDFEKAIALQDVPGVPFNVSGPGYTIPGYFWRTPKVTKDNSKVPTVIVGSGYDAPQQDTFHTIGHEVLSRGWNFVTYEGPGQATTRRQQGIGFTPDWWNVVTPVVGYLAECPDVDMENLALGGLSFGGLLAPLAASREPRLKAVLSIDGLVNFQDILLNDFASLAAVFEAGNVTEFNSILTDDYSELPTSAKWGLNQGLWAFNTDSAFDFINQTGAYTLTPEIIANISGYGWVGKGENDTVAGGQELELEALYNKSGQHLGTFHYFASNVGAGLHTQLGAEPQLAEAALDWLSTIFS
ncbi:alpha/beta-hydrolase [Xylariaceae sp. FL0255]|nr:alpha/beta-hydrolase [Xylariaceae sp. FL0255]